MERWPLAVLLLVAGSCKTSEPSLEQGPAPAALAAAKAEPAPVSQSSGAEAKWQPLRYKVNDQHVEVEHLGDDFALLDVKELPPVQDWKTLLVRNTEGREFTGTKPILLTGTRTMRVVTLPSGAFEFRVIEPGPDNGDGGAATRIRHKMTNAKSIIIHTKDYQPPKRLPPESTLLVKSGNSERKLDRATMDTLERDPEPGEKEARDTWTLGTLRGGSGLDAKTSIRLTDGDGKTLDLLTEELLDSSSAHFIKRNRRGQFNYRRWNLGPPPKRVGEMRGVVSMELL